ncbi:DinB family protein [Virgibacillus salexigens]|uniref:DinB family protein n=1 Tax=Virgibacillus salexigens TaxID=61016 RepID=UPI00190C9872|nr:DinB family protein [Virgibacillus salexigens]
MNALKPVYQDAIESNSKSQENTFKGALLAYLSELVQHIVSHGTYHRRNLTDMICQHGYSSSPTEYALYPYEINSTKKFFKFYTDGK